MARSKKKDERLTEYQIHKGLLDAGRRRVLESCDEKELQLNFLNSINGFLGHIDCCLSRLVDYKEREVKEKNASDA